MSRHPIPYKRRKRRRIGWMIFAIACIALIVLVWRLLGPDEAEAAEEKPLSEETTLHPQECSPTGAAVIPAPTNTTFIARFTDEEIRMAAQTVWGEARGVYSQMEQAAVVWCFLNRVDEWGDSLGDTVAAQNQFAYNSGNPTVDDYGRDLEELVRDVVSRWEREKNGETGVGRVLPGGYLWFSSWDGRNWFRSSYENLDYPWSWRLPNPYGS